MTNLKTLSAAAALALVLPLAIPSQSFAQRGAGGPAPSVGGGGGAAISPGGGGMAGGGGFAAGGRTAAGPGFTGARVAAGPGVGGGYYGGHFGHRHHGGFWPGVAVGAALGSYAYYDGPYPAYDDDYYYDTGPTVAVVPGGADAVTYCEQRFRSYDPASGTYLGFDGQRHPCP